jgi:ribosome-associated protein
MLRWHRIIAGVWMSAEPRSATLDPQAFARDLAHVISDAHGSDILVLDITPLTTLADYFLICTADNERMLRAIVRAIDDFATQNDVRVRRQEGTPDSGWVLLDFGDVIAHVFGRREREFYQLDRLWADAPRLLVIQ